MSLQYVKNMKIKQVLLAHNAHNAKMDINHLDLYVSQAKNIVRIMYYNKEFVKNVQQDINWIQIMLFVHL